MATSAKYKPGDEPVPGYRLETFLGRGGFGEVWKAVAPGGTEAAVKIINLSGTQGLKEFKALRVVKRIRHPNLVPLVAYWLKDEDGNLLDDTDANLSHFKTTVSPASPLQGTMTLEAAEHSRPAELIVAMGLGEQDLFRRLEQCQQQGLPGIPDDELLRYMEDAARAIDYLNSPRHNLGTGQAAVQHCDIKPFNIMIVGEAAQVCDFGLARVLGDVRTTALNAGTLAYVAPEVLLHNRPSQATDQYSLAITYHELKTGRLPYAAETYSEIISAVTEGRLDLSSLSDAQQAVIRQATALDPAQRYPTAVAMVQALRRAVEGAPPPSAKYEAGATPTEPRPRRRTMRLAGGAMSFVAVVALAAAGWHFWRTDGPRPRPPAKSDQDPEQLADAGEGDPIERRSGTGLAESEAFDLETLASEPTGTDDAESNTDGGDAAGSGAGALADIEPGVAADGGPAIAAALDRAEQFLEQARFEEAIAKLDPLIAQAPADSQEDWLHTAYLVRGTCYLESADFERAEADLTEAIRRKPNDARAYSRRGTARLREGDIERAIDDFTAAIVIEPDPRDCFSRGLAWSLLDERESAIGDFSEAIRLDSDFADAYYARGQEHAAQRDYEAALLDYSRALALGPVDAAPIREDHAHAADALAEVAWQLATAPDAADRDGPRAVELAKLVCEASEYKNVRHLEILAAAYTEAGEPAEAEAWSNKAAELKRSEEAPDG